MYHTVLPTHSSPVGSSRKHAEHTVSFLSSKEPVQGRTNRVLSPTPGVTRGVLTSCYGSTNQGVPSLYDQTRTENLSTCLTLEIAVPILSEHRSGSITRWAAYLRTAPRPMRRCVHIVQCTTSSARILYVKLVATDCEVRRNRLVGRWRSSCFGLLG
ncbi:hypothetical protein CALCODRAFT_58990 [Calocera cornea HHB12733]|uniref:Uncharacterized protein n=1 Tax=Calocera cornea HHB12733 TaxID=1353952 RepID=A0A165IWI1_9BASI|nr:hypothetical protein CALCODRAFT_58990 [Calocera cornea HHB12733]